jgi:hypothetical protein
VTEMMNHVYWAMAAAFSAIFAWQLLAMFFGHSGASDANEISPVDTAGGADADAGGGQDAHPAADHGLDATASFKLLSIRSISAFGLLFGWSGVLYTKAEISPGPTALYSFLWGMGGMLIVSALFYLMARLSETGTRRLGGCVGERGSVYMDIPAGGTGQVRVSVGGVMSFIGARVPSGEALKAGTPVVVKRCVGTTMVEVEKTSD